MSAIPMASPAYGAWVQAYGLQGEIAPVPTNSRLIGGTRNGERVTVPSDLQQVVFPVRTRPYYAVASPDLEPSTAFKTEIYEKRTFLPAWSAAPVRMLVAQGLSDDDASALLSEWTHDGTDQRDWDAEFLRMKNEAHWRRLREWRDSLEDE